ncbi:MAG: response regulator [Deltaproteobacteria bacterium]|nr:response regulator [Deltaproteobacteria bacterium]MBN2673638.1 response regulator [Deltaproteobacteria bacterium]
MFVTNKSEVNSDEIISNMHNDDQEQQEAVAEELMHAKKMEALGALAGGMAHDMNNILASILAVASAMDAEMPTDHPYATDVKDILNACKRGSKLTRGLLSFARRHRVNFADVQANEIVNEIETILTRTISKGISIETRLEESLHCITADPDQLNQVLMNICLNAVDAMKNQGRLIIETENIVLTSEELWSNPEAPPGDFVQITIRDTGPGIPKELQEKVFEPFFSTKPKGKGTGLGLAMAYGTVKKHNGIIRIDSDYQHGTSFVIQIPANAYTSSKPAPIVQDKYRLSSDHSGTILLVDDEDLFRISSKRILEKLGYNVICCTNGKEAAELFSTRHNEIDIVILDMIMPVMGGREAFFKLRGIDASVPILIASGFTEEENIKDILSNGAIGFIGKPFDLQSLSDALPKRSIHQS